MSPDRRGLPIGGTDPLARLLHLCTPVRTMTIHANDRMMTAYSRTVLALIALLLSCHPSGAKSKSLQSFIDKVSVSCVSFDYSFTAKAKDSAPMRGEGRVKASGPAFMMEGNGIEVWCDGRIRWTVDRVSEEAVIEDASGEEGGPGSNPALLLVSVDAFFREISSGSVVVGGVKVDSSVLEPLPDSGSPMGIRSLKLYFKPGTATITGAWMGFEDGTELDLSIVGFRFTDPRDEKGSFRFDEKTLGDSFVVTDLR